jgi:signal transduction histidine kinase
MADETELGRVLTNLFENARRYGRNTYRRRDRGGELCARQGSWVVLSVRDHGPGVAAEKLAELTTPFFRGDAARTAATGAGLGLAIVEKACSAWEAISSWPMRQAAAWWRTSSCAARPDAVQHGRATAC